MMTSSAIPNAFKLHTAQVRVAFAQYFGRAPEVVAFAPGRIEFIGNHTDYNGGPVLGAAIDRGVWVALARNNDGRRRLLSPGGTDCDMLDCGAGPFEKRYGNVAWTNYPLGILATLPEFGFTAPEGFDYLAQSDLPAGAGLSSSAAIELASALGFLALSGQQCDKITLAKIGRKAENERIGVPCGILDQGVSAFGKPDHLVHIDCRLMEFSTVPMPQGLRFWVFNTHTKHSLIDGLYAERHRECMAAAAGLGVAKLAEATADQLTRSNCRLTGVHLKRARHVVDEVARVRAVISDLADGDIPAVGRSLVASHQSSRYFFENSTPELDYLVDVLTVCPAVWGARLTGGGFGGAVLALTNDHFAQPAAQVLVAEYTHRFGVPPDILQLRSGGGARVLI